MSKHKTDEIYAETSVPDSDAFPPGTIRFIDVHIYDQPAQEEVETVNSEQSIEDGQAEPQENNQAPHEQDAARPSQRRPRLKTLLFALLILCLGTSGAVLFATSIFPHLTPDATVTIVPRTQQVAMTTKISVVPGQTDTTEQHIQGRVLPTITMSQAQSIVTTGTHHQDASSAHGTITFYNFATFSQTIPAGELLTGADGVQVVTDQDAFIAAGTLAINGRATVRAHTIMTGPAGNIRTGDIYGPCCRVNISAVNSTFAGGQEARTYQTATAQDITNASASLTTSFQYSVQAALQTQVHSDETLITPRSCTQSVTADHQPGEEAVQVHLTVSETCISEAYATHTFHDLIEHMMSQQATKQLGTEYIQRGEIQTSILQVSTKEHGVIEMQVKSVGTWAYQLSQERLEAFTHTIVGKGKREATDMLLHLPGVQTVSIELKQNTDRLPDDEKNIHLLLLETAW